MKWLFDFIDGMNKEVKDIMDWSALGSIVATFFAILPNLSALVGFIWLCLRVWEMDTVKGWTGRKVQDGNQRID